MFELEDATRYHGRKFDVIAAVLVVVFGDAQTEWVDVVAAGFVVDFERGSVVALAFASDLYEWIGGVDLQWLQTLHTTVKGVVHVCDTELQQHVQ